LAKIAFEQTGYGSSKSQTLREVREITRKQEKARMGGT
jgi:hypothetical protein